MINKNEVENLEKLKEIFETKTETEILDIIDLVKDIVENTNISNLSIAFKSFSENLDITQKKTHLFYIFENHIEYHLNNFNADNHLDSYTDLTN